jgi:hypothetical protein
MIMTTQQWESPPAENRLENAEPLGVIEIQAPPHVLHYLNATGDTRTTWDPENADEVAAARAQFDDLKKKGFLAYSVKPGGAPDKLLRAFDPDAGKIIMKPPMAGG